MRPGALLLALLAGSPALALAPAEPSYARVGLRVQGRILEARFHDVDQDGRDELVLAVWSRTAGRREIRVHRQTPEGLLTVEPDHVVPVLKDVVAFCWADVRSEPGDELVLLTRGGAWSFSITRTGFRGNFVRLVETELLYDVPDPGTLPFWDYTFQLGGRDALLLPDVDGFSIWGPGSGGEANGSGAPLFVRRGDFTTVVGHPVTRTLSGDRPRGRVHVTGQGISFLASEGQHVLLDSHASGLLGSSLVATSWRHRSPALVDLDGDGRQDLLRRSGKLLHVHLAENGTIPDQPYRTERYPTYLEKQSKVQIGLAELDGDGDIDLLVRVEREEEGVLKTNSTFDFLVMLNDGSRLFPERPHQILRFEGTEVRAAVTDVDGDGRPDLVVTKMQAPDLLELSAPDGLVFSRSTLVFLGGRGGFSKKPDLKHEDVFDEQNIADAIVARRLSADCSGDGRADLVDVDLRGHVAIHRVVRESSFFGGVSWRLDEAPWKKVAASGSVRNLDVRDINGDDLGDILTWRNDALTVLLSRGAGGR